MTSSFELEPGAGTSSLELESMVGNSHFGACSSGRDNFSSESDGVPAVADAAALGSSVGGVEDIVWETGEGGEEKM